MIKIVDGSNNTPVVGLVQPVQPVSGCDCGCSCCSCRKRVSDKVKNGPFGPITIRRRQLTKSVDSE